MNKALNISSTPTTPNLHMKQTEKKIGKTTFIITTSFNGDKNRNIGASLARIISRDAINGSGFPKISA